MAHTQDYMDDLQNTARGTGLTAYTGHASLSKTKPDLVTGAATPPVYAAFVRKPVTLGAPTSPSSGVRRVANTAAIDFDAKVSGGDEEVGWALLYNALTAGKLYDAVPLPESGTSFAVTAATNASPIVLTIGAHAFANGMFARVAGVGGNTAANGDFTVTVVSATQISLNGTTGNGAYTSGGTCRRFGFTIQDGGIPRIAIGALYRDKIGGSL